MLNKLKYALIVVPLFLLVAAYSAPPCYKLYDAKCCALGDGTANSGFTPGTKTYCVNSSLGSPWYCPTANPGPNAGLENDWIVRKQDCPTGATGCWTEWRNSGNDGKCTHWRYTCSTTVHGACSPAVVQAAYDCKGQELLGIECTKYASDEEEVPAEETEEGGD